MKNHLGTGKPGAGAAKPKMNPRLANGGSASRTSMLPGAPLPTAGPKLPGFKKHSNKLTSNVYK